MIVVDQIYDFIYHPDFSTAYDFGHPYAVPAIVLFYIVFCKWIGPALMAYRKPFVIRNILVGYNFFQVFLNGYISYSFVRELSEYWEYRCHPEDVPDLDVRFREGQLMIWHVYLSRFVDLLDTVFFVLRKKKKQITFLHIFHHAVVCILSHIYVKGPIFGYYLLVAVFLNCFVHVFMYLYYGLAAIGPHIQKYLWWKRHLTHLQIIQFLLMLLYMTIHFVNGCEKTGVVEITFYFFVVSVLLLFLNFYRKSFKKEKEV